MKFLIDNQLPVTLCTFLRQKGHEATHVIDIGLDASTDHAIWQYASQNSCIVMSKDEDFVDLAHRFSDQGVGLVWIRIGHCRTPALLQALETVWDQLIDSLAKQERIIEVR